ncbi:MAG: serine proteinase [Pseudoflavonifractor sp.]
MAFFDDLKDKAMDLGRAGVAKSKQLAEIAKLNLENSSEEDAIKKAYIEIGKLYYAERGMSPDAAFVSLCEKITAAKINIEENKNRIADLKVDEDQVPAAPSMQAEVPPEEPNCTCCEHEEHEEDDIQP